MSEPIPFQLKRRSTCFMCGAPTDRAEELEIVRLCKEAVTLYRLRPSEFKSQGHLDSLFSFLLLVISKEK